MNRPEHSLLSLFNSFISLEPVSEEDVDLSFIKGNPALIDSIKEYMRWDRNPSTRGGVRQLIASRSVDGLSKLMETRMQFGTAGLRGRMGAGFNAMNDLVIIQTSQGFAMYLESVFPKEDLSSRGVVIGYDGRHNSERFAVLAAIALTQRGHLVRLFSAMCPTPWVPFTVTLYGCCAGIMVTASHNPKEDNGYKVYWSNGAQIISPHDKGIQNCILGNLKPWEGAWMLDKQNVLKLGKIVDPFDEVLSKYFDVVACEGLGHDAVRNNKSTLKFCYTPMHGVGYYFIEEGFKRAMLPSIVPVEEQKEPHPDFPTVKFPNPEEGKSALNLAIQTANKNGCPIILANDPDADRLAVAERLPSGEWKIFNGNEIGALLGWWCLQNWIEQNGRDKLSEVYMISSTVSSKILKTIADAEGFNFRETLTGFKWMANLADELSKASKTVLFAFEEAIGFMVETIVLDKDGISAAIRMAEMAVKLNEEGLTLNDQLMRIYERYGFHTSRNSYYLCYEPKTILNLFDNIRKLSNGKYPESILNGKYKITRVRDLTTGFDSGEPDNKATLPVSKGSQMITFYFQNGLVATLRTSGTEPKIKYYTELCASSQERDCNVVKQTLDEMVNAIIQEWIQPSKWGISLPPDTETDEEREVRKA